MHPLSNILWDTYTHTFVTELERDTHTHNYRDRKIYRDHATRRHRDKHEPCTHWEYNAKDLVHYYIIITNFFWWAVYHTSSELHAGLWTELAKTFDCIILWLWNEDNYYEDKIYMYLATTSLCICIWIHIYMHLLKIHDCRSKTKSLQMHAHSWTTSTLSSGSVA